ncbi:hypothetical protein TELCIR_24117, partial [Teladorsagia circumcincta]
RDDDGGGAECGSKRTVLERIDTPADGCSVPTSGSTSTLRIDATLCSQYHKGSSNVIADHLSRSVDPKNRFHDDSPETDDIVDFPRCLLHNAVPSPNDSRLLPPIYIRPYDALLAQKQDPFCSALMHFLDTGSFPLDASADLLKICSMYLDQCIKKNGCLYYVGPNSSRRPAIVVPQKLREPICIALHESATAGGHFNWKKTLAKVSRRFFWPSMREDIFKFVRSCDACQRKRPHPQTRKQLIPIHAGAIFDK